MYVQLFNIVLALAREERQFSYRLASSSVLFGKFYFAKYASMIRRIQTILVCHICIAVTQHFGFQLSDLTCFGFEKDVVDTLV